jgi:hypothetical protein
VVKRRKQKVKRARKRKKLLKSRPRIKKRINKKDLNTWVFFDIINLMQKVKEFFGKLWGFIKKHKWSISLVLLAIMIGGFFVWDSLTAGTFTPGEITIKKKEEKFIAPLSGLEVTEKERTERKPMAVVVENHPDARPQSGLNKAAIVYETFAEGGITRFLAVFQENDVAEIGPVRSARPYFVEWAYSYKAFFAHVGGNIDALDMIGSLKGFYDLNQFYFGSFFWRDAKRYAPHNVYTTTAKLVEAAKTKGFPTSDTNISAYQFKKETEKDKRPINSTLKVVFNANFTVTWNYIQETNEYHRFMLGKSQTDRQAGEQIKAKNIIVMFSDFSYGKTRIGEQATTIRTTGSGSALFFIDGVKTTGTWKRSQGQNPTRYYDPQGVEIKLNPGTTWVEVAPTGTVVE